MHRPQLTHSVSSRESPRAGLTTVSKPRLMKPYAATPTSSLQMRTQRPHRMHLFGSSTISGWRRSTGCSLASPMNVCTSAPYSVA